MHRNDTEEPPVVADRAPTKGQSATPDVGERARLLRRGLGLVRLTMAYNVVEAGVATWAGFAAGSIALVGFGFDAVIEFAAAAVLLWRLGVEARGADHETVERTEVRVLRFVGFTFLLLAAYVVFEAATTLFRSEAPSESPVGLALATLSLVIMPVVAWSKLRVADRLGSRSLRAEAKETLACSMLSLTLLVGLGLNSWLGWWWADPVAALAMVPWLIREGLEGLRGERCEDGCHA